MAKKVIVRKERRLLDAFFKVDEAVLRHERRDGSLSPELSRLNLERGDGVAAARRTRFPTSAGVPVRSRAAPTARRRERGLLPRETDPYGGERPT